MSVLLFGVVGSFVGVAIYIFWLRARFLAVLPRFMQNSLAQWVIDKLVILIMVFSMLYIATLIFSDYF